MASQRASFSMASYQKQNVGLMRMNNKLEDQLAIATSMIKDKTKEVKKLRRDLNNEKMKSSNLRQALMLIQAHCINIINNFHSDIQRFLENVDLNGTLLFASPAVHQPAPRIRPPREVDLSCISEEKSMALAQNISFKEICNDHQPIDGKRAKARKSTWKKGKAARKQKSVAEAPTAAKPDRPKRKSVGVVNYSGME